MQTSAATYKHTNPTVFHGGAAVVDYYGADNDNYVAGEGFCCGDNNLKTKSIADDSPNYEKLQYYYHSDHLGSASYITNLDGEVVQHIEYVPFGEVFLEERNNTWNTPFLFNGKELDEETGLYYYGARYYNPRISLWLSTDPLQEKYPHVSTYAYTFNNPVKYIDPTGMEGDEPETSKNTVIQEVHRNGINGNNSPFTMLGNPNQVNDAILLSVDGEDREISKNGERGLPTINGVTAPWSIETLMEKTLDIASHPAIGAVTNITDDLQFTKGLGTATTIASVTSDIYQYHKGSIDETILGYRLGSTGLAAYVGSATHPILGLTVGTTLTGVEKTATAVGHWDYQNRNFFSPTTKGNFWSNFYW